MTYAGSWQNATVSTFRGAFVLHFTPNFANYLLRFPLHFLGGQYPPFLDLKPGSRGLMIAGVVGSGQGWDILEALMDHFNFTPLAVRASKDLIGSKEPQSNEWDGIIQLLITGVSTFEKKRVIGKITYHTLQKMKIYILIKLWSSWLYDWLFVCSRPCVHSKIQGLSRPVMIVSNLDTIEFIFN